VKECAGGGIYWAARIAEHGSGADNGRDIVDVSGEE
jgi:hypothetical protein